MQTRLVTFVILLVIAGGAAAYAADTTDFEITNNGWTYREENINKPANEAAAGQPTNFFFRNEGNDVLAQNWWWFRAGGTAEDALTNLTSLTVGTSNASLAYDQVASNGAPLHFTLNYILTGIDPSNAVVEIDWSVTNQSVTGLATPIDVFSYTNTSLPSNPNQQAGHTVGAFTTSFDQIDVKGSSAASPTLSLIATGPNTLKGWEIADFKTMINQLTDSAVTNFPTAAQSLTANIEAGFQWEVTSLAAGGTTGGILFKQVAGPPVVPEAGALLLALPGLASIMAWRRRRG